MLSGSKDKCNVWMYNYTVHHSILSKCLRWLYKVNLLLQQGSFLLSDWMLSRHGCHAVILRLNVIMPMLYKIYYSIKSICYCGRDHYYYWTLWCPDMAALLSSSKDECNYAYTVHDSIFYKFNCLVQQGSLLLLDRR